MDGDQAGLIVVAVMLGVAEAIAALDQAGLAWPWVARDRREVAAQAVVVLDLPAVIRQAAQREAMLREVELVVGDRERELAAVAGAVYEVPGLSMV